MTHIGPPTVGPINRSIEEELRTVSVGRDGQYAKCLPAEMLLVLLGRVRGEIRAHLALEACLQKIGAGDGHSAAVDLDHKAAAGAIGKLQTKHKIRDKPDLMHSSVVCEADAEQ